MDTNYSQIMSPPSPFASKSVGQRSFRGGTRGNAVPIVEKLPERMGTAFPLLKCLRTHRKGYKIDLIWFDLIIH